MQDTITPAPQARSLAKPVSNSDKLRGWLEGDEFKMQVARALPKHLTPDRFIRVASTALMRVPKLAECEKVSFFNCLLTLSQLGLEPDGRNAHLIPFENRKRGVVECQLIIDYKGLVDLAMRSGNVSNIHADKVCENDEFEYNLGEIEKHRIDFRRPRGAAYAFYALVRFKDGTTKVEVMPREDVEAIRTRSRAGQSGPWVTDFDEMAKKTAFRRLSKWIQLSPEFREALDNDADRIDDRARFEVAKPIFGAVSEPTNGHAAPESQAEAPAPRARKARKLEAPPVQAERTPDEPDRSPFAGEVDDNQIPGLEPAAPAVEPASELHAQILTRMGLDDIDEVDLLETLSAVGIGKGAFSVNDIKESDAQRIVNDWNSVVPLVRKHVANRKQAA